MIDFYRRFLPGLALVILPLTSSLAGPDPKEHFLLSDEMKASFLNAKKALSSATALAHPGAGAPIQLSVDASNTHVGMF